MLIKSQVELNVDRNTQSAKFRGIVVIVTSLYHTFRLDLIGSNFLFNHISNLY